jgi:hypothetical protein
LGAHDRQVLALSKTPLISCGSGGEEKILKNLPHEALEHLLLISQDRGRQLRGVLIAD